MVEVMDQRALIFLHIPKTAGTTLNRIIEWQYNPLSIFTIDPYGIRATAERLQELPEERRRRLRMVRGHCYYGLHKLLPQGATYITMLRDPVKRFGAVLIDEKVTDQDELQKIKDEVDALVNEAADQALASPQPRRPPRPRATASRPKRPRPTPWCSRPA